MKQCEVKDCTNEVEDNNSLPICRSCVNNIPTELIHGYLDYQDNQNELADALTEMEAQMLICSICEEQYLPTKGEEDKICSICWSYLYDRTEKEE